MTVTNFFFVFTSFEEIFIFILMRLLVACRQDNLYSLCLCVPLFPPSLSLSLSLSLWIGNHGCMIVYESLYLCGYLNLVKAKTNYFPYLTSFLSCMRDACGKVVPRFGFRYSNERNMSVSNFRKNSGETDNHRRPMCVFIFLDSKGPCS